MIRRSLAAALTAPTALVTRQREAKHKEQVTRQREAKRYRRTHRSGR